MRTDDENRTERIKALSDAINKSGVSINGNTRLSDDEIAEIEASTVDSWATTNDKLADALQRLSDAVLAEVEKLAKRLRLL